MNNVVILSIADYANSGNELARAITSHKQYNVRAITLYTHRFGYNRDIVLFDNKDKIIKNQCDLSQKIINDSSIIHCKGDEPAWFVINKFKEIGVFAESSINKPRIVTTSGSLFRRKLSCNIPGCCMERWALSDYFDARIRTTMTPDLNYPDYKGMYIQQTLNTSQYSNMWRLGDIPIISHSPSRREYKRTDILLGAIEKIKNKHKLQLNIIENEVVDRSINIKKQSTLFFDQAGVGFYGNALIEAAQFGIPCMAWISDVARAQSENKIDDKCPVIGFDPTINGLADKLDELLSSPKYLQELSINTKIWVDKFHDYSVVGKIWTAIYDKILSDV